MNLLVSQAESLSEIWLKNSISVSEVASDDYNLFRIVRIGRSGGAFMSNLVFLCLFNMLSPCPNVLNSLPLNMNSGCYNCCNLDL